VSSSPHVVLGKRGWYFYIANPVGNDFPAIMPLSREGLEAWQHLLEARRDWLARHGSRYLFVIAPDKQSIYPDFLPQSLRRRARARSRLDQLVEHLQAHSNLAI